jgi:hypothetical protein
MMVNIARPHGAVSVHLILNADEAHSKMIEFFKRCQEMARAAREATNPAGFAGTTWPMTSQSKKCRSEASRALTVGAACSCCCNSIQAATWSGWTAASDATRLAPIAPGEKIRHSPAVGAARVRIADPGREELRNRTPAFSPAAISARKALPAPPATISA